MARHVLGGRQGGHALGARRGSLVGPAGERPAGEVGDVVGPTLVDDSPQGGAQGVCPSGLAVVGRAPPQRLGQVVEGGHELAEEPGPPAGGGAADDLADRVDDVVGKTVVGGLERAAATQAVEGELPDRLEQAVPRLGSGRVDRDERGVRQLVQQRAEPRLGFGGGHGAPPSRRRRDRRTRPTPRRAWRPAARAGRMTSGWCRPRCGGGGRRESVAGRARRHWRRAGGRSRRCSSSWRGRLRSRWRAADRRHGGTAPPPPAGRPGRRSAPASRARPRNSCTDGHAIGSLSDAGTGRGASGSTHSPGRSSGDRLVARIVGCWQTPRICTSQ